MRRLAIALLVVVTLTGSMLAQNEGLNTGSVSASVFASAATRGNRLLLLVLWRLAPTLIGAGDGTQSAFTEQAISQRISFGPVSVNLRVDRQGNVAYVGKEQIALAETNVVLVDIDAQGHATITDRMRVNPEPANSGNDRFGEAVIRREPVLREFLHCDQFFPSPTQQYVAHTLCARTLGA
jgi:hypothetical protein